MAYAAGIGRCVRSLVPRLARDEPSWRFTLLGDRARLETSDWAAGANISIVDCRAPIYGVREQWRLGVDTPRDTDVFWAPHYNAPAFLRIPLVVTVHDVAHLRLPEFRRGVVRRLYASALFRFVRERAAEVLCDSEFSRGEFEVLVGVRERRPVVVHNGIEEYWFNDAATARPIAERYFVYVGGLRPHKNLATLIRALETLTDLEGATLVLVGDLTAARTLDASATALKASLGVRVRPVGEISDDLLRAYIRHAEALVMPSLYEGFGFPPLEAMASGTPAIVARAGSLPEVCGDAALYFDPRDSNDLAQRMREIWNSSPLRRSLSDRGRTQARRFSWDLAAKALAQALGRAANA